MLKCASFAAEDEKNVCDEIGEITRKKGIGSLFCYREPSSPRDKNKNRFTIVRRFHECAETSKDNSFNRNQRSRLNCSVIDDGHKSRRFFRMSMRIDGCVNY